MRDKRRNRTSEEGPSSSAFVPGIHHDSSRQFFAKTSVQIGAPYCKHTPNDTMPHILTRRSHPVCPPLSPSKRPRSIRPGAERSGRGDRPLAGAVHPRARDNPQAHLRLGDERRLQAHPGAGAGRRRRRCRSVPVASHHAPGLQAEAPGKTFSVAHRALLLPCGCVVRRVSEKNPDGPRRLFAEEGPQEQMVKPCLMLIGGASAARSSARDTRTDRTPRQSTGRGEEIPLWGPVCRDAEKTPRYIHGSTP